MLYHQFKITWRNILKNKTTGLINLLGLTLGLTAAMLIGIYVFNEWQTDRWIPHADRTYRLLRVSTINGEPYDIGVTSAPFATSLKQDYPDDVEATVRVLDGSSLVKVGETQFQEEQYYYTDPNFLTFFDFPLMHGDAKTALSEARSIVLTLETARRYFGDEKEALGKTLQIDNDYDAVVTGVLAKIDNPTHLNFDLIESNVSLYDASFWTGWWNNMHCTYFRLAPEVSSTTFASRFPAFMDKYFGDDFARTNSRIDLKMEPIRAIYFASETRYDPMRHGNKDAVNIFFFAALLLLIIACANYVNLSTVQAIKRNKEVGVLKVLGSGRKSIIGQMLSESFLFTLVSVLIAIQVTTISLPYFEQAFGLNLAVQLPFRQTIGLLAGLVALITIAAGLYPGVFLSSFKPINALKGTSVSGDNFSGTIRKSLVVFQFVLSVGLLCSTFLIEQQLDFLSQKNLGFDKDHVLLMSMNSPEVFQNRTLFKEQLLRTPGIQSVSYTVGTPGGFHDATTVDIAELNKTIRMRTAFVDFDFVKTFELSVTAGRNFDNRLATDSNNVVLLNERAVAELGMTNEEVLGKEVVLTMFDNAPRKVIGVVKNYHFSSLRDEIEPLVVSTSFRGRQIAIKANGNAIPSVIAAVEKAWNNQSTAYPFTYQFLDERLNRLYQSEARQGQLFSMFAAMAIFIACLGMFGLSAFAASIRTKEIGIRKVLGASIVSIIGLLSKDFLKLVMLAFLIAIPFSWYFVDDWLNGFAYRITIQWWVFALTGITAIGIAFLTVSFQSVKAALVNPVQSLKSE